MFEILGRLLEDLRSKLGGEDAWNASLMDSGGAKRKTLVLTTGEFQDGNAYVRLVLLAVTYGEGCIHPMAQEAAQVQPIPQTLFCARR